MKFIKKMKRKHKILAVFIIILLLTTPLLGYLFAKYSDVYQYSEDHIKNSTSIIKKLGPINNINLKPFGYAVEYRGPTGWAEFEMEIIGNIDSGILFIRLEKKLGQWKIIGAKLDGKEIKI
ncbi:MAG: hypothetical protein OQL19_11100 [Gammaproteobacteria bacterium]|nr:hypothetical protein [Gammaproteobacteria bacterium]